MNRRTPLVVALAASLAACAAKAEGPRSGPFVAKGDGVGITADELEARIDEQNPLIRPAFAQMDAKKMLVDNLLKVELLARAAEKEGLTNDPDVRYALRTVLASKYQQKFLQDPERVKNAVSDAEVAKYYEEHADEFHRPLRAHVAHIFVAADASGPARARKRAEANKLLQKVLSEERKNRAAFSRIATESSDEAESKATGGDLMYKSREELEKAQGSDFAALAFATGDDQTAPTIVETAKGFHLVHVYGRAAALDESLEQARPEITRELLTRWKVKAFNDLVARLRAEAGVTVDDAALARVLPAGVPVASATPPSPGDVTSGAATAPAAAPAARATPGGAQ
jgi:parvulin-like peptidyl-prolyl isomerase